METGVIMAPWPGRTARLAAMVERMGFSTLMLTDSQNLAPEVFSQLMLAAAATTTLKLGTGVSNPVTRDSALLASSALSVHAESGGRAVLGIGRGDSAVQRIGKDLYPLADFRRYIDELQGYLRGEAVDRDGFESRLEWFRAAKQPKLPVQIAATGPKVIELAAQRADAVMLAVGADPDHLAAAIARARRAAEAAGRPAGELRIGAFVNTLAHGDASVARDAVRGTAATFARFSSFKGSPIAELPGPLQKAARFLREHYDMAEHTRRSSEHARAMEDEFIDWFALAGPVGDLRPRFEKLAALGLDFLYLVSASADTPREVARASLESISKEILPLLQHA
ncbi:MAG: LLM class flavin-dependent oxidoreductase [Myxococcales bacterium]|nr:LLM class flavin-dependent oxidoreductase [Myxococcales bacterium]